MLLSMVVPRERRPYGNRAPFQEVVMPPIAPDDFRDRELGPIVVAIRGVGIPVRRGTVGDDMTLPGVMVDRGALVVDETRLLYAGDVLHDAGHITVMTPRDRALAVGVLPSEGSLEMAALAWSYAVAVAFELDLEVVFHDAFKGGGPWLRETFSGGGSVGVPMLQWFEMTRFADAPEYFAPLPVFPRMAKWLRDSDQAER